MLKDKQAATGLHMRDQHSGYNPVELSRWQTRLWGLNRADEADDDTSKSSTRASISGLTRPGGVTDAGRRSGQSRSWHQAYGSDIALPGLEAQRFKTRAFDRGKARAAFSQHRAYWSQGRLVQEAAWPPRA